MQVVAVSGKKQMRSFVRVPERLFGDHPCYAPPIWISAAAISIIRWGTDHFRDCDTQVKDLRRIQERNKFAIIDCSIVVYASKL